MACRDEVFLFGYVAEYARNIGKDSWKAEASGDVGKSNVNRFARVAHTPVVYVNEKVHFDFSEINGSLKIRGGFMI